MKALAGALAAIALCATPFSIAAAVAPKAADKATPARVGLVPADSKLLVVFANPVEGQDAAFNVWYDKHMRDFMKLPNFVRVQKFKMLPRKGRPDPQYKYLFLFEFKGDQDISFAQIQAAMKEGRIDMPDKTIVGPVLGMNYAADGPGYPGPMPDQTSASRPGLVADDSRLLVVFANPVEGQDEGFNVWYDQHMRDFMKFPNYVEVQRFKMLSRKGRPDPAFKYLFFFEFKGDQDVSFAQTQAAIKEGRLPLPDPKVVAKVEGSNYAPDGPGYRGPAPK